MIYGAGAQWVLLSCSFGMLAAVAAADAVDAAQSRVRARWPVAGIPSACSACVVRFDPRRPACTAGRQMTG